MIIKVKNHFQIGPICESYFYTFKLINFQFGSLFDNHHRNLIFFLKKSHIFYIKSIFIKITFPQSLAPKHFFIVKLHDA